MLTTTLLVLSISIVARAHVLPWEQDTSESDSRLSAEFGHRNGPLHGQSNSHRIRSWWNTAGNDGAHTFRSISLPHLPLFGGKVREYYIGAVERDWDYAPTGKNLVNDEQSKADELLRGGDDRIGRVYTKVLYRRFTDGSFTEQIPNPQWMGFMGPLIKAQERDTIVIHFKNMAFTANRNFSVHPHGVLYNKSSEGALYVDGTSGADKNDDHVAPGDTHTYIWKVERNYAPTRQDKDCLAYVYHSHVNAPKDISTGLMGPMMICKRFALSRRSDERNDVDRNYFAYFDVTDENESWLMEENLKKCGQPSLCQTLYQNVDSGFEKSNKFPGINGRVFGNLEGFEAYQGEKVALNIVGLEQGIHGVQIYGQTFEYLNRRYSTLGIYPATFVSAMMVPRTTGRWLMLSKNSDEYPSMAAFFNVINRGYGYMDPTYYTNTRKFYIAAEETRWNYGPSGLNNFEGGNLTAPGSPSFAYFEQGPSRIGAEFKKAQFFAYTDSTFTTRISQEPEMGILGPVIRAEVNERVEIVFKNMASRNYSFLPHGVKIIKQEEGAVYKNDINSDAVTGKVAAPGETVMYKFSVPYYVGPTNDDADCISSTYHSAVDPVKDIATGLIGPLVICKAGSLNQDGKQKKIDKEFHLLFFTFDESLSWYLGENIQSYTLDPDSVDKDDANFRQSLRKHSINGRMYANLDGLDMCLNERVIWHVYGLGGFFDLHGVHFHGNTMSIHGLNKDAMVVIPGTSFTGDMEVDNEGSWAIVCRTNFHFFTGMKAIYNVHPCGQPSNTGNDINWYRNSLTRRYYIAVEEITWDYAPSKIDPITLESLLDPNSNGYVYARNDSGFIGTTYQKLAYVEYTDSSFATKKQRTQEENHLGILGPYIKAEVGDTIIVTLKNKAAVNVSIHPHGVLYQSGANRTVDGHLVYSDTEVASAGSEVTYTWKVPPRAGPGNHRAKCASWPYYSFTDSSVKDTNTGLIGPLVICERGTLRNDGKRKDVDRELTVMFTVMDENQSWLLDKNIHLYAPNRTDKSDAQFTLSNQMASVNGYIFANVPDLTMGENQDVAWYIIGMGSSLDIHTVHFHGQTFVQQSNVERRHDVIEVFPSTSETVDMYTDNPGSWIIHCHFGPHIKAGMEIVYTIEPCKRKGFFGRCVRY